MRCAPITRTRRSWRPSASSRTVRPSIRAAKAASGANSGAPELRTFAIAAIGLKAIDPRRFARQPLPDRQQQARDDMDRAFRKFRDVCELCQPGGGEAFAIGFAPMAFRHPLQGNAVLF